jgi:hypothetical protein
MSVSCHKRKCQASFDHFVGKRQYRQEAADIRQVARTDVATDRRTPSGLPSPFYLSCETSALADGRLPAQEPNAAGPITDSPQHDRLVHSGFVPYAGGIRFTLPTHPDSFRVSGATRRMEEIPI